VEHYGWLSTRHPPADLQSFAARSRNKSDSGAIDLLTQGKATDTIKAELIRQATKYKRQYPDEKRDDDKKKKGGDDTGA